MHRCHKVLVSIPVTALSSSYSTPKSKRKGGGTQKGGFNQSEREIRLSLSHDRPPSQSPQNPTSCKTLYKEQRQWGRGGGSFFARPGRWLTQPSAGQRWLAGERLNPHPGVRPMPQGTPPVPQPNPELRREFSAAPGPQPGRGVADTQHFLPVCFR
jgi:hypothetical protein